MSNEAILNFIIIVGKILITVSIAYYFFNSYQRNKKENKIEEENKK